MTTRLLCALIAGLIGLLVTIGNPALARELPVAATGNEHTRIDNLKIRKLLDAYLQAHSETMPAARIRFKSVKQIKPFVLPAGTATCEIIPAIPKIIGSRRFTMIFRVDGQIRANFALHTELEALAPVAVAAIDLPRGVLIAPGDVRLVEKDLSNLREPYLDAKSLVGKKVRRALRAGTVLQKALLETPPVVRRGDSVTMTVRSGAMILTARGAARDNGVIGDTIRVRNNDSQKDVLCRVAGPGAVEVEI